MAVVANSESLLNVGDFITRPRISKGNLTPADSAHRFIQKPLRNHQFSDGGADVGNVLCGYFDSRFAHVLTSYQAITRTQEKS